MAAQVAPFPVPHCDEEVLALEQRSGHTCSVQKLLENQLVYRVWQAPFADVKFAPIERHNDLATAQRVLDVGCGPGTNAAKFTHTEYLGLDMNPNYVEAAQRRHQGRFAVADVRTYVPEAGARFDCVLLNSFLHHIDDRSCREILQRMATVLDDDGHIHIVDLVLPKRPNMARLLARLDRGDYARPLQEWRTLFARDFEVIVFEPYRISLLGLGLWELVYFKGRVKTDA